MMIVFLLQVFNKKIYTKWWEKYKIDNIKSQKYNFMYS